MRSQNKGSDFFHRIFLSVPSVLSVPVSILKIEGQIYFLRIFSSVLSVLSGRVSILKIEGQIFFLRIFSSVLSVPVSFLKIEGLYCLT